MTLNTENEFDVYIFIFLMGKMTFSVVIQGQYLRFVNFVKYKL